MGRGRWGSGGGDVIELATAFVTIRPETGNFASELESEASSAGDQAAGSFSEAFQSGLNVDSDVEVPVTADTEAAEAELAGLEGDEITVGVDADTAGAEAEIEGVPDGEAEVNVTANTDQAEQKLDELAESAQAATGGTGRLGDVAQGAAGGLGGLSGAAGGAVSKLGPMGAAAGAAAGGLLFFAHSGIEAESAAQRFELVAGGLAGELQSIDVGGLSGDIGDLALRIGSSDEAMLNATATFAAFGQSSGAAAGDIAEASDNINALALRAAAMNPALGDAGAVAERLRNALARGGRSLTEFGIGLSSSEINARALADTGKESAADLTQFEKAAAGASIAVERLGGSMGEDFAEGAENAALKLEALKESLGEGAESIGGLMLPAIGDLTHGLTDLSEGIQDLDLGRATAGFLDFTAFGQVANGLTHIRDSLFPGELRAQGDASSFAAGEMGGMGGAADEAAESISNLSAEVQAYLDGTFALPEAQRALRASFDELFEVLTTEGHTADEVAEALQGVAEATAGVGVASGDMDAAVALTLDRLAATRDSGLLTEAAFNDIGTAIARLPGSKEIPVTTPGLTESTTQVGVLGNAILGVPPHKSIPFNLPGMPAAQNDVVNLHGLIDVTPDDHDTDFAANTGQASGDIVGLRNLIGSVDTYVPVVFSAVISGFDAAANAISGLRDQASRPIVVQGSVRIEAAGVDVGRSSAPAIVRAGPTVLQTFLDGQLVAESVAYHDRRASIAEGYEQP